MTSTVETLALCGDIKAFLSASQNSDKGVHLPNPNSEAKITLGPISLNVGSQMILSTAQCFSSPVSAASVPSLANGFVHSPTMVAQGHHVEDSEWTPRAKKRNHDFMKSCASDSKRLKRSEKLGKGLRHFSMKVCEKVQRRGITTYNEVADELVAEFTSGSLMGTDSQGYDQKNIRRRVYDALNVLMAMNIISKEKKEIRWVGLPTNSAQECQNLELEKQNRMERIRQKRAQLQELILQQIAFKNLVQRNQSNEVSHQAPPPAGSVVQLPFIILNTSMQTIIDCSISSDKCEYLFNFDNTFEIHDDIEILKRMGMSLGLESGRCTPENLRVAKSLVPKSLESYVSGMAQCLEQSSLSAGLSVDSDFASLSEGRSHSHSSTAPSHSTESRGQTPTSCEEEEEDDEDEETSSVE